MSLPKLRHDNGTNQRVFGKPKVATLGKVSELQKMKAGTVDQKAVIMVELLAPQPRFDNHRKGARNSKNNPRKPDYYRLQIILDRNANPQRSSIQNLRVRIRILRRTKVERMTIATKVTATTRFVVFDGWTQATILIIESDSCRRRRRQARGLLVPPAPL
jgi:hypothetical protein